MAALSSKFLFSFFKALIPAISILFFLSCQQGETRSTGNSNQVTSKALADSANAAGNLPAADHETDTSSLAQRPATLTDTTKTDSVSAKVKVVGPEPLPGSILPYKRIVAFYGNPLSKRMGILGELPEEEMLAKLDEEVANWEKADPSSPVQPALHLIAVTAQGKPGRDGKYRLRMTNKLIEQVIEMAKKRDALVFLDIQVGRSTLQAELPRLAKYLQMPNVHLGIDAEFAMDSTGVPGRRVGSFDAADINYASQFLANLVKEHNLPPKVFVIHRFTYRMIRNSSNINLDPRVQIVMHMDGWGSKALKKDTYRRYIVKEPVQYTGFKLFYKNDTKKPGWRLMTPEEILKLNPIPVYIQYQ